MPEFIQRAWHWIILLWGGHEPKPQPRPLPEPEKPEPEPEPEPPPLAAKISKAAKAKAHDVYGQFYFREQILDQLDDYFRIIRRMRKYDPIAYSLYSRIGAHVMPYHFWHYHLDEASDDPAKMLAKLSPWWKLNRPSFGCVALVHPDVTSDEVYSQTHHEGEGKRGWIYPRFCYFTKYQQGHAPPNIQPNHKGDVYVVSVYWTDAQHPNWGDAAQEFPIVITPDNEVLPLKMHIFSERRIRSRRKGGAFSVPEQRWDIHPSLKRWAAQHNCTPEEHLRHIFIGAANTYEIAQYSMVRIDVKKQSMHAVFGVDVRRTPYFFRDRAVTLGEHGHRKRIFHIVRAHRRETGAYVKTHFRGERLFDWNGYRIRITVPGKHHVLIQELDVGSVDAEKVKPGFIGQGHLGHMLQQHLDGVPLKEAFKRKDPNDRTNRSQSQADADTVEDQHGGNPA